MISKEQYAYLIYKNHAKSKYTYREHNRYISVQCGTNPNDAYLADISIHQLGRRYITIVITASESFLHGPFASQLEAENTALQRRYDGPSNDEILRIMNHLMIRPRSVEIVDEILSNLQNMTHLGYVSILSQRRNDKLTYVSHTGYLEFRNAIKVACVETRNIFSEAHARVALYNALQCEYDNSTESSVGIDSIMYE